MTTGTYFKCGIIAAIAIIVTARADERLVKKVTTLKENTGRGMYSPDGSKIAFQRKGTNGYYNLFLMDSNGSNETCLIHDNADLPDNRHKGEPSWSPDGTYIAFKAQKTNYFICDNDPFAAPGIGFNNDLWLMTNNGSNIYRLTNLRTKMSLLDTNPVTGILGPQFSQSGAQISWSEKLRGGGKWGTWAIKIADLVWTNGYPGLTNIQSFQPGEQVLYYESNDFSQDDKKLLICGNLQSNQMEIGMDIYEMEIGSGSVRRLTFTTNDWDESGHYSRRFDRLVYISSRGFDSVATNANWWEWQKSEFWLMDLNGGRQERLTYFNTPGYDEYTTNRTMTAYMDWHPTGKELLGALVIESAPGASNLVDRLVRIELNDRITVCDIAPASSNTVALSWSDLRTDTVYRIEQTEALSNSNAWDTVCPTDQWPITSTVWTGTVLTNVECGFYRVIGSH